MKNDDIRFGVIGCAGRGAMTADWHRPGKGSAVVAACDVSASALDWFRRNVNAGGFITRRAEELLARDDIDAVAVTSPDWTHEEYACKALSAGKHVFCEKPMAITTKGCDRMLKAWVDSGKHFMIGFNMRYMNIFRVMKDAVDSGAIGEVRTVWVRHFVGAGGGWYYHDWHASSKNTTGLLLQKASHDLDMIHWITGRYTVKVAASGALDYYGGSMPDGLHCPACRKRDSCIEFQHCDTASDNKMDLCVFRREVDVEDSSIMMMELEGGIHAVYMQCHYTPDYCRNYTFIGTEGRIENLDDGSKVVVRLRNRSKRWKNLADWSIDVKQASGGHGGADPLVFEDFMKLLRTGKRPIATPLAGRMSVAAGCAATRSLRNGWKVETIPPVPTGLRARIY